jgi:hypothetical protein
MVQKLRTNSPGEAYSEILDSEEDRAQHYTTLFGFEVRSEPMPGNEQETLFTLTHAQLPGLAYSESDPWGCLLAAMETAMRITQGRMESGEPFPLMELPKPRQNLKGSAQAKRVHQAR